MKNQFRADIFCILAGVCFSFVWLAQPVQAQDESPKYEKELEVLAKYVGPWRKTVPGQDPSTAAILDGELILEGAYLQRKFRTPSGRIPGMELMTYDGDKQRYRLLSFSRFPNDVRESIGTWDDARQSMTWTIDQRGSTATLIETFETESIKKFTSQSRRADGTPGPTFSGTDTRLDDLQVDVTKPSG